MPSYSLLTSFTDDDLDRFHASGSNVVVAKPNNGGDPNVAWVVFRPLSGNSMSWEDNYGIYASNTDLTAAGTVLHQMSKTPFPAVPAKVYELTPSGVFAGPGLNGSAGSYKAVNSYNNLPKGYLTFGLYQDSEVNGSQVGGNAVSATPVIYNSQAVITPFTTIYLWIASQVVSNSVITIVTSPQTKVTFGGSVFDVSLAYDAGSGTFIPASGTTLGPGIALEQIEPAL
jgi:hypothetical protein